MQIKLTYPARTEKSKFLERAGTVLEWLSLIACVSCPIVNYFVGGKWWAVIVVWSVYAFWSLILSPDIVERNIISQTVKALLFIAVLLALIDYFLAPGWAHFVIPILGSSGLLFTSAAYMIDFNRQRQNAMPMIWLFLYSLVFSEVSFLGLIRLSWPVKVLGGLSCALIILGVIAFRADLALELKKRFHMD